MTGHTLKDELDAAPAFSLQTHASMTPLSAVHPAESPKPKEASLGLDDESAYVFDECPDPQALGLRTLHEFGKSRVVLLNVKPTATNLYFALRALQTGNTTDTIQQLLPHISLNHADRSLPDRQGRTKGHRISRPQARSHRDRAARDS